MYMCTCGRKEKACKIAKRLLLRPLLQLVVLLLLCITLLLHFFELLLSLRFHDFCGKTTQNVTKAKELPTTSAPHSLQGVVRLHTTRSELLYCRFTPTRSKDDIGFQGTSQAL